MLQSVEAQSISATVRNFVYQPCALLPLVTSAAVVLLRPGQEGPGR